MSPLNVAPIKSVRIIRELGNLEGALLNAIDQAVIATDMDGTIIFWNRFAEDLFGWTADEVLGRNILDVTPTADSREAANEIMRQLQAGKSWHGEFSVRHKDGRWFPVRVTDIPLRDDQGRTVAIMGTSTAVTDSEAPTAPSVISRIRSAFASRRSTIDPSSRASSKLVDRLDALLLQSNAVHSIGLALLFYSGAVLARIALDQVIPERLPYISFFPAVLLASFFCGPLASALVSIASAATGAFWSEPEEGNLIVYRLTIFALFTFISGLMLLAILYLKNILRRLQQRDQQLALINREMKHRIKNLFAIMHAICLQTVKSSDSTEAFTTAITGRISAVASAQDVLSVVASEGSDLRSLVEGLVQPVAPSPARLTIEGPSVTLPSDTTTPFALVLHELATNAVKHGAWRSDRGQVSIQWRVGAQRELDFRWREHDGPAIEPATRQGLGSMLIKRGLNQATVDYQLRPDGLDCHIRIPLH